MVDLEKGGYLWGLEKQGVSWGFSQFWVLLEHLGLKLASRLGLTGIGLFSGSLLWVIILSQKSRLMRRCCDTAIVSIMLSVFCSFEDWWVA